ncbi:hypothetical protein [uncultured Eudoraea sp.]|uniref:hypothetical protein n=1 Tax=uncultured Eudoraea sp. TaxID=1035614 RepID=UPI002631BE0E|nr:hypothetical protein [uncultured Eudoraea sp.]
MKILSKWLRTAALYFITVILLQGCVVYDLKNPVTLNQAFEQQKKVKVKTNTYETMKYRHISFEDGQFYGVNKKSGEFIRVPLDNTDIIQVFVQNKSASTWVTVAVIAVPIIALAIIAIVLSQDSIIDPDFLSGAN